MLSDAHISSLGYLWGNSAFFRVQGTRLLNIVKKVAHVSDCILARVPHMTKRIWSGTLKKAALPKRQLRLF